MTRLSTEERDEHLVVRLRQLDVAAAPAAPGYDYDGLLTRDARGKARARRRHSMARGAASALVLAMVAVSVWRLSPTDEVKTVAAPAAEPEQSVSQPRLVRADTWLALAAIEDHIATIDDALSDARLSEPRGAEVARLERTRAELMNSYASVRYAEMVSTNF
ncbi:MAG TPA: hypothetical protein VM146_12755 [Steroidobacteraceae bacterium]|nr:hypothetical protein [Steroidobacteraceae bacterium]